MREEVEPVSVKGDWNDLIRDAQARGWEVCRITKGRHVQLMWPPTGRKVTISGSSEPRAITNAAKQLAKMELVSA